MKTIGKPDRPWLVGVRRRDFIRKGLLIGGVAGIAGSGMLAGCGGEDEEEISPAEDLMREHGVLNRIMLIYDACRNHLSAGEYFSPAVLTGAAQIIKTFIEDYHEKLEEDFLFPRFRKAKMHEELVSTLLAQHQAGRMLTAQITQAASGGNLRDGETAQKMISLLSGFNIMYRPHEAREDTVLFPAIRRIISANEYFALGEDFENKEHELFGKDGFEEMVGKVYAIEQQLGIADLSMFTPAVQ